MNNRVKFIRKELGISQAEFGQKLSVTKTAISGIEIGRRNITDRMIKAICKEFKVNYDWLTTGEGEAFLQPPVTLLDNLAIEYSLTDRQTKFINEYLNLTLEEKDMLERFFARAFAI